MTGTRWSGSAADGRDSWSSTPPIPIRPAHTSSRWTRTSCERSTGPGGTILHTSRTNPAKVRASDEPDFLKAGRVDDEARDHTPHVMKVLDHLGIDALIPIGGDDTLSFALRLHDEGVPVVAVPKTMDNDVHGTDYCIGFSTAVTRTVIFIHQLRTSAGSHERLAVVEVFGRYSGETSLVSAYLSGMDRAIISEVPFDVEKLATFLMDDKRKNPSRYAMTTISEGAHFVGGEMVMGGNADAYGHRKLGGIGAADRRGAEGDHRRGDHLPADRLPDALWPARFARPDGGDQLRGDGGGSAPRRAPTDDLSRSATGAT